AKPALASLAIFAFIGNWNMLWEPLIYLSSTEKFTLSIGLTWFQAFQIGSTPKTHLMLAYSILMTAPVLAVFFTAQRYFIRGIARGGGGRRGFGEIPPGGGGGAAPVPAEHGREARGASWRWGDRRSGVDDGACAARTNGAGAPISRPAAVRRSDLPGPTPRAA